jgi:hypothetical protein
MDIVVDFSLSELRDQAIWDGRQGFGLLASQIDSGSEMTMPQNHRADQIWLEESG